MLELRNVSLEINGRTLIKPLSLCVAAGEVVTLMGASGSGKTSLLSFVGGDLLEPIVGHGEVVLMGQPLQTLPTERRGIARLFQDDLLFPHMSVAENLLFAVPRMAQGIRMDHGTRMARVHEALQSAELQGFENRAPHTLSGGQRQRVALMRALLAEPKAILLDEPFSKLDKALRQQMRDYVFGHIRARAIAALLVTHDQDDAPAGGRIWKIDAEGTLRDV